MKKNITVIGGGISGLSCASHLAKKGHKVTVLEKNKTIGGRARFFEAKGFKFDMGPSWYWMPDVFERFFNQFGHKTSDFYTLERLDPSYRIYWEDNSHDDIPAEITKIHEWFEAKEKDSSKNLSKFLKEAKYKYQVGMTDFVFKPSLKYTEFLDPRLLVDAVKLDLFTSFSKYIRKSFKNPKILSLLEFPTLFLGAMPSKTPALYSLMNYADICLGTWYPNGGMNKIIEAFEKIAIKQGVEIKTNHNVKKLTFKGKKVDRVVTNQGEFATDILVSSADYQHTESKLLGEFSNYKDSYWNSRTMAPSSLLFYVGVNKKINSLKHHNLFFDEEFDQHATEIYETPKWPKAPLFYVCAPSKSDKTVAPEGCENVFLLMPIAPGIKDDEKTRNHYFEILLNRIEKRTGEKVKDHIIYKKSYCLKDFMADYNAFKGNAYGLANTLNQTAIFKPSLKNKKLNNMYYTGQLTVPGPGVPPSIISGEVVANQIQKSLQKK